MDVRLPNGVLIQNVPEGATKDEIRAKAIRSGLAKPEDFGETSAAVAQIPTEGYNQEAAAEINRNRPPPPSWVDYAIQGAAAVPVMAAGSRALQLLTRGSKVAPYAGRAAEVLVPQTGRQLAFEGALGATAGVAGGLAGEQVPEGWQRDITSMVAGGAAAAPFAFGRNAFDLWVSRGMGAEATAAGREASKVLGQARASAQAMTAIEANPNLVPTVIRANEIEKATGVSLPTLAAANGDTTISSYLQGQVARGENAGFAAALKTQYEAAEAALTKAQKGVAPSMQAVDAYVKRQVDALAKKNQAAVEAAAKASEKRQQGLENINARLQQITAEVQPPSRGEIGTQLTNLLSAKEAAIRSTLSPQYETLIKDSMEAGIVLPGKSASNLRIFASDSMNDDVFSKFPGLYSLINRHFRTPVAAAGSEAAKKYKFAVQAPQQKDIPLNVLDSLKREVNKSLRDTNDKDQIRKLVLLKQEVEKAIDSVDPAFSAPYREIDKQYATQLGIPFNQQGVVNIDRAKFVEDAVPAMTKNASSLKQTLGIVGDSPEGLKLVEDAFMFDISNNRSIISTATGEISPTQLRRYIAQNKDKIDLVPGLRQKLERLGTRTGELQQNRAAILQAEKEAKQDQAKTLWEQAYGTTGGLREIVRRSLGNAQELDKLLAVAGKSRVAKEGIKSAMLDDVLSASGNRMELLANNRQAFEKVFGVSSTRQIEMLVEASQRLKDNPFVFRINPSTINKTQYESVFGSKPETTLGEFRNQVLSAPRVFINHISRYFQNQANKDEAAEVQKFLLDPKNLQLTAEMVAELESKGVTEKTMGIVKQMLKNSSSAYLFGALTGGIVSQGAPATATYQPSQPGMLQGFGQPQR